MRHYEIECSRKLHEYKVYSISARDLDEAALIALSQFRASNPETLHTDCEEENWDDIGHSDYEEPAYINNPQPRRHD